MQARTVDLRPSPGLAPWVSKMWVSHSPGHPSGTREHVLPTGQMHLVWRLAGPPLRLFKNTQGGPYTTWGEPVLGGARDTYYVKAIDAPVTSVGVQLRPGAALALFGVSADELAGRHTPLGELCGAQAADMTEQLQAITHPMRQLAILDAWLLRRAASACPLHPTVKIGLQQLSQDPKVAHVVRTSDYSHRGFVALFRHATGLGPKRYARLLRFQQVLQALGLPETGALAELAVDLGYSDQAHMAREFRAFAGTTLGRYRSRPPDAPHHVQMV